MSTIKELEDQIKSLQIKINEIKNNQLYLYDGADGNLYIKYLRNDLFHVSSSGNCWFSFRFDSQIKLYEDWVQRGSPISDSIVEWRGKRYTLIKDMFGNACLAMIKDHSDDYDLIYDLNELRAFDHVKDKNIRRFSHNNQPIIF